jgi:hypothetical protein
VDDVVPEFLKQVEMRSRLENSGMRICDMILRSPSGRVRLAIA